MKDHPLSVNVFGGFKKPSVLNTISIVEWLSQIKNPSQKDIIIQARSLGKADPAYDKLKAQMPCITPNFRYKGYKKDDNLEAPTGLLYIDIDDPRFDIDQLDKSKVYAYYKSFGGGGYGILVRVNNLTPSNFKDTYQFILNDLGVLSYFDNGACKASQFNVMSYDENLYHNPNSFLFDSTQNTPMPIGNLKKERIYTTRLGVFSNTLRFDNLDEVEIPEGKDYVVDWNGIQYIKCEIPMKKVNKGGRNSFLLAYCNNLVCLNPHLTEEATATILWKVNTVGCSPHCSFDQVKSIVRSIFKYKEEGTLEPKYYPLPRKIVFKKDSDLTGEEKSKKALELCNNKRAADAKQRVYDIIEDWDFETHGKITGPKIYTLYPINKKTVNKYYKEFKQYVRSLNQQYKDELITKPKTTQKTIDDSSPLDEASDSELQKCSILNALAETYFEIGLEVDYMNIQKIQTVMNQSYATQVEICETIIKIARQNRYSKSPYKDIQLPREIVEWAVFILRNHQVAA